MKKILLSAVTMLAFTIVTKAQFSIGIKAGANQSTQYRNDVAGTELFSKNAYKGYHVGLVAETEIVKNIYLQPQIVYTHKGAKLNNVNGGGAKLNMNYIDVPVNIVGKIETPIGKLFAGAGPVLSYGFGGKMEQNGQSEKMYKTSNWKRVDLSLNAIAGLELKNGLFGSVSYQRGMKDIYKGDAISAKNRSISVSVGYMLDWNRRKG